MPEISVTLPDLTGEEFTQQVVAAAARQMLSAVSYDEDGDEVRYRSELARKIENHIVEVIREQAREAAPDVARELLARGTQQTNTWGDPAGGMVPLSTIVAEEVKANLVHGSGRRGEGVTRLADSRRGPEAAPRAASGDRGAGPPADPRGDARGGHAGVRAGHAQGAAGGRAMTEQAWSMNPARARWAQGNDGTNATAPDSTLTDEVNLYNLSAALFTREIVARGLGHLRTTSWATEATELPVDADYLGRHEGNREALILSPDLDTATSLYLSDGRVQVRVAGRNSDDVDRQLVQLLDVLRGLYELYLREGGWRL